jgi:hypothetical protein
LTVELEEVLHTLQAVDHPAGNKAPASRRFLPQARTADGGGDQPIVNVTVEAVQAQALDDLSEFETDQGPSRKPCWHRASNRKRRSRRLVALVAAAARWRPVPPEESIAAAPELEQADVIQRPHPRPP